MTGVQTCALPILKEIIQKTIGTWRDELINDFENPVFTAHPQIKEIKDTLYQQGALYAAMSGSGSTVFGIFNTEPNNQNKYPVNYFVKVL